MEEEIKKYKRKGLLPKSKRKKKKSHKVAMGGIFISIFFVMSAVIFLLPDVVNKPIYEANLTITGSIGEGYTTPVFSVSEGQQVEIKIINLRRMTGHSLVVYLQGGGSLWYDVVYSDTTLYVPVAKDSMYSVRLSINSKYVGGEIRLKVIIDV